MKILMFGRGVIATVYGWALHQAGHDVEFYVRPGRAATYGDAVDLDLFDMRRRVWGQRVVEKWPVRYREALEPDHDFDLIVLSVPHHRLPEATAFLSPRVGQATVLVFGNLWTEPSAAIGALPVDRIAWGFPQAGGGFGADGVLRGGCCRRSSSAPLASPRPNGSGPCARRFARPGSGSRSSRTSAAGYGSISCRTPACSRRACGWVPCPSWPGRRATSARRC
ncbi:hypothetical protein GCM10027612_47860 [Microbispora bryophytorum subsp. camponoti]